MSSVSTKSLAHPFQTDDPRLRPVYEKVLARELLDLADVTALYASKDILALGWLANYAREQMHGNTTRFVVHEFTDANESDAAQAVMLESDLGPLCRAIEGHKKKNPQVRIAALSVEEIAGGKLSAQETCRSLRQAGADSLIGGGAELFLPAIRRRLWHHSGDAGRRADVRQAALAAGLDVPLYLVQRDVAPEQQAEELLSFRQMPQTDSFAAVSFAPDANTSLHLATTTGMQEMKQIAVARLALAHVAHIRAYWQMLGGKLLQIALRFGAGELDGTPLDPAVNLEARRRELAREIQVAGREPQEMAAIRKYVVVS